MPASLKPGVSWDGLDSAGQRIRAALDKLADTFQAAVVVTCTTKDHKSGKHPLGQACDVRTVGWNPANLVIYYHWLVKELGPDFYVQYETPMTPKDANLAKIAVVSKGATAPHMHIQLRQNHTFPA